LKRVSARSGRNNNKEKDMNTRTSSIKQMVIAALAVAVFMLAPAQAQTPASKRTDNRFRNPAEFRLDLFRFPARRQSLSSRPAGFSLTPGASAGLMTTPAAGPNLTVMGSGTLGRLPKWTGFTSSHSIIGDSTIFEDKFGNVGIGTDSPTSRLTVVGTIAATGGFKFPDGTVQTTAGITNVIHDTTLRGNGTAASPLGVAVPLFLTGATGASNPILTVSNISDGGVGVSALGGAGGEGVRASGGNSAFGGAGVTATGGSSSANIALGGSAVTAKGGTGTAGGGRGVSAIGGDGSSDSASGGDGVSARGAFSNSGSGGDGLEASGGGSASGSGGRGVRAEGGASSSGPPGHGVEASGGNSGGVGSIAGNGVSARGGDNPVGFGGSGVVAIGGNGSLTGNIGGIGIFAEGGIGLNGAAKGLAGSFTGDVLITGNLNVTGTKNFKIDHPLDPENRYLVHAAIESSEVLNIYSGNVQTNAQGEATVTLPEWFEALNKDIRYQLTVVGTFAQAMVAEKVKQNRFTIRTNAPNVEVSWQVTGVRFDASMRQRPFKAEEEKPERERGHYLNPEAYGQPEERAVEGARHPEMMQRMKESRSKQVEKIRQNAQGNDR
jgi:trimeric autotransporter adhesin